MEGMNVSVRVIEWVGIKRWVYVDGEAGEDKSVHLKLMQLCGIERLWKLRAAQKREPLRRGIWHECVCQST